MAIFIYDSSKKLRTNIVEKQSSEKTHIARQTESFTSTVSHEMRTPIGTAIFFVTRALSMLPFAQIDPQIVKFLKLVISQLTFMQSFVEDLLDLR